MEHNLLLNQTWSINNCVKWKIRIPDHILLRASALNISFKHIDSNNRKG